MSNRKLRLNQIRRHGAPEEVVTVTEWDVTPGLHEWITEEIERREQNARAADKEIGREWRTRWNESADFFEVVTESGLLVADGLGPAVAGHIAAGDPATMLRWCAADRKILAAHPYTTRVVNPSYGPHSAGFGCETCHDWDGVPEGRGNCPTVLALAEAYGLDDEDNADVEVIRG
ncbi:hypothetical protein ACZ90_02350 [Streptomyces albus subsp. albus]|uniref:DUF6221 family protein n=2 Tax=Streptomyces TaxID=1883 RepID=UPI0004BE08C1|nr:MULTISPECIES: DUF6221 family protein [Streptomyces]KOG77888.1 hypothetical protein ADK33_29245 [Streptomyces griseus subsp. rhodochrous]KUJ70600.1 hypothetical protein ACZ90_02350 [Streptomyces albus subsp. albus]